MTEAPQLEPAPRLPTRRRRRTRASISTRKRAVLYALITLSAGAIAGWLWHAMVSLPTFLTSDDGSVQITERAQGQIFATDGVYVTIGLTVGVGLGLAAWMLFRQVGWLVGPIAVAGGLLAGGMCWLVGLAQGPRNFAARVSAAVPGEQVPIDFELHTPSALLVWGLGAIIPVMLYANLSREEPRVGPRSSPSQLREGGAEQSGKVVGGQVD